MGKKQEGITLITLVITIVLLILLAGISINLLLGENGLITKAKESKKLQKIAEIKEKISLELLAEETDAILRNEILEEEQLNDIISKYGTLQEDKDTILIKDDNYEISLKEIWYGTLSTSGSYSDKKKQIEMLEKELEDIKDTIGKIEKIKLTTNDLKTITSHYQQLTIDNFACIISDVSGSTGPYTSDTNGSGSKKFQDTLKYDSSTGTISVIRGSLRVNIGATTVLPYASASYDVYLYIPSTWLD